jgi:glycosyltransferase involved in cell wall biosynthesis
VKRILYVVNHAAFFASHRLPIALAARAAGYEIALATGLPASDAMEPAAELALEQCAVPLQRMPFSSSGMNPLRELWGLAKLCAHMHRYRPDLVHCASPKGLVYGGMAARLCRASGLVLAVSGMGFAFTRAHRPSFARGASRLVFKTLMKWVFRHPNLKVIVQNADDREGLLSSGLLGTDQVVLIKGSGIPLADFVDMPLSRKEPVVLLPARMVADKGVREFLTAASELRAQHPDWRFVLAGAADYKNPTRVPPEVLRDAEQDGTVEWHGHVHDMRPYFARAAIVCLPSYREGMPKSLLEAAAAACAVVTTDVVGCREAIQDGETGILVPARDSTALAEALRKLMEDAQLRARFALAGRSLAVAQFGLDGVIEKTLAIYESLLAAMAAGADPHS